MTSNETRPVVSDEAVARAAKWLTCNGFSDDEAHYIARQMLTDANLTASPVPQVVIPDKLQKFEGFMLEDGRWFADTWTFARDFRHDGKRRFHQRGHGDDPVAALIDALRGDAAKAEVAS